MAIRLKITKEQYDRIFSERIPSMLVNEAENPAFDRSNGTASNMRSIWDEIDRQQSELYDLVFGELSGELGQLTKDKAKQMGYKYLTIPKNICRAGNAKLPENVLIINMSSSLMCPSYYLGTCTIAEGMCYAQKDENRFSADKQMMMQRFQTDLMHTQMLQQYANGNKKAMDLYFQIIEKYIQLGNTYSDNLMEKYINTLKSKYRRELTPEELQTAKDLASKYKVNDVRLNETGDFHCQLAVDLWTEFARVIKEKYGIKTHAYTARNLDFTKASQYIAMNPSHDGIDTGPAPQRTFKAVTDAFYDKLPDNGPVSADRQPNLLSREYKVKGQMMQEYYYKCPCNKDESKCDLCGVCFEENRTNVPYVIYVRYHGSRAAKGLMNLFTKREMNDVMQSASDNGWFTDDELKSYNSDANQQRLHNLSGKIWKKRNQNKRRLERQKRKKENPNQTL